MKNTGLLILFLFPVLLAGALYLNSSQNKPVNQDGQVNGYSTEDTTRTAEPSITTLPQPTTEAMNLDTNKKYTATLKTTSGDIVIELNIQQTPITANNFITLAKKKFYDKTIFHRVIKGFMIQGGDPNGDGTGGPGYKFKDEPFEGEYTRGTVAMANAGPNTNGSQFFIMHQDNPLPKNYVIFGKVIQGMEVVDTIANSEVEAGSSGESSKPVKPTVVETVEIQEQ